jgi:hypothetical protein
MQESVEKLAFHAAPSSIGSHLNDRWKKNVFGIDVDVK